ncbi:MAG: GGDEF domain-containing protein [Desulfamplus sp.]|nr:GGDEF domain-containing protein [Desulfamplus sp.]MBF0412922.1 GGDEF domain-containing protein [Desulfamplus sp.]
MKFAFKKLFQILPLFFNTAASNSDHNKLAQHIINLNQQNSIKGIINEMAVCLKEILNYRLFAFVIQRNLGVDVWLDPRMYKKSLELVFIQDFHLSGESEINYLNHTFNSNEQEYQFDLENLVSYILDEENCHGKIYMLTKKNMASYHDNIVAMILKSTAIALSKQINIDILTSAAAIDPLTGCYNRREFEEQMRKTIASAKRHKNKLSVFMFDIDHFKKVNDTYGHQAGDVVLQRVSDVVRNDMRTGDILARYGGEEFIAILPSTGKQEAIELAERLRDKIEEQIIVTDAGTIKVTASFGIASLEPSYERPDSADMLKLIEEADSMMYKAKLNGRNTVMPGLIQLCQQPTKNTGTV